MLLMAKGASLDSADSDGLTPLHMAAKNGHLRILELFLAEGIDAAARVRSSKFCLS